MEFFLAERGSWSSNDERIGEIEVPLWYKHLMKHWLTKKLLPMDIEFNVNNRMYRIAPSSLHGLGLFSMDGIIVKYNKITELMDYVVPCYNYSWNF